MPIAFVADRGNGTVSATSPWSLTISTANTVAVGNTLVLFIGSDNSGASGVAPTLGITDPRGNTWTLRGSRNVTSGAALDGQSAWVYTCRVTNAYTAADALSITNAPAALGTLRLLEFSGVSSTTTVAAITASGLASMPSVSITPTTAGQLVLCHAAIESGAGTWTGDSDTTNGSWSTLQSVNNGTSGATGVGQANQWKIVTAGGAQSWAVSFGTLRDWAAVAVVLDEAAPPEPPVQLGVSDLRVEMWIPETSQWGIRTSDVRAVPGIRLSRGRTTEDGEIAPAQLALTLDNTDGQYSPGGTDAGGNLATRRNRPIRVGFGNPSAGRASTGSGTSVTAASLTTVYPEVAVMAVAMMGNVDNLTTPGGYVNATEQDATAFTVKRAFTTDSGGALNVIPAATFTATTGGSWATAHVAVPNGTYVTSDGGVANAGNSPASVGLVGLNDGDLVVLVCGWTSDPNDLMTAPFMYGTVPAEFVLVTDSGPSAGPRLMVWTFVKRPGHYAVQFLGADDGTTGATVQVGLFTGQDRYTPRFCGEISDWRRRGNATGTDLTVDIVAGGAMRRALANTDPLSPLRASLGSAGDLTHYWPMEDPPGSTSFAPAVGGTAMVPLNGISAGAVEAIAGSLPTPDFTGRGARGPVYPRNTRPYGYGGVFGIPEAGTATGTNLLTGEMGQLATLSSFGIEYTSNTSLTVKSVVSGTASTVVLDNTSTSGLFNATFPTGINGKQILIYIGLAANGANIDWSVSVVNVTPSEELAQFAATGSIASTVLGPLGAVTACQEAGSASSIGTNSITAGHVFVTEGSALFGAIYRMYAARGWAGAQTTAAFLFATPPTGFRTTITRPLDDAIELGAVPVADLGSQLRDMSTAGQGLLSDAAGFVGLEYRPLRSVASSDPVLTLEYDDELFGGELGPVTDDAVIVNDVTVTATGGGMGRVVREDGDAGVESAGRYARAYTLPVRGADGARDLAGWMTTQGTFESPRWPEVTLVMKAPGMAAVDMQMFSIGDTVRLTGLPSWAGPDEADIVVVGLREEITDAVWTVTLIGRPAGPYAIAVIDGDTRWSTIGDASDLVTYPPVYLAP